ncbi:Scd6-like Sm domain-containing protein [Limtongia smithiae]|uniref:Scd6-like Sm domain-containing protein n=1 Tax=Limtongia smithiae TaxID=1125753 RepID=UPI0034CFC6AF
MSQFIGRRISLFSNSDIRYVGYLHEIDSEAATLTLKNVQSKGTEGRRGDPALEVEGFEDMYDFICFRGADVKDLVIEEDEPPVVPPKPTIPNDPAILQSGSAQVPQQSTLYAPQQMQQQMRPQQGFIPPYYPPQQYMPYPPPQYMPEQVPRYPPRTAPTRQPVGPSTMVSQQAPQPAPAPAPVPELKPEVAAAPVPAQSTVTTPSVSRVVPAVPVPKARQTRQPKAADEPVAATKATSSANLTVADDLVAQLSQLNVEPVPVAATSAVPDAVEPVSAEIAIVPEGSSGSPISREPRGKGPSRPSFQNGGQRGVRRAGAAPGSRIAVPVLDFDFQESNSKFSKDDVVKEVEGDDVEDDASNTEVYYDKTSSFFDNISSGTKERFEGLPTSDGRLGRQEERKLNMETFGQVSVDTRFRGRGRGRGRGGYHSRGGYGRGGFRQGQRPQQPQQQA